jgi:endonuclease III
MKNGSVYAERIRKAFQRLVRTIPKGGPATPMDPLRQAAAAVLGKREGLVAGAAALDRILKRVVDWNEVRVSTPDELAVLVGGAMRHSHEACEDLIRMLNGVFRRENTMSLDRLAQGKIKDARRYLESLPGFDPYVTASVLLWSLDAHAIPVNDRMLERMRREEWVDPGAGREEVQGFLERHVKAQEAKQFAHMLEIWSLQRSVRTARPATGHTSPRAKSRPPGASANSSRETRHAGKAKRPNKSRTRK